MFIKSKLEIALRKFMQFRAERALRSNSELWKELQEYTKSSESTGCGYIDYLRLYQSVRSSKVTEVLECGTGVTTLVIAHALMENEKETGVKGRVTSMEEHGDWLEMSRSLLPSRYENYVDFVLSDTVEDYCSLFRGNRYSSIPERAYDFVFVDGPKYKSPIDGGATFDFDFLHVLRQSEKPVAALIDKRLSTVFVLQQLLGKEKVRYSVVDGMGYVKPSSKQDLGDIQTSISSANFAGSFKLFGNSSLMITQNRNSRT